MSGPMYSAGLRRRLLPQGFAGAHAHPPRLRGGARRSRSRPRTPTTPWPAFALGEEGRRPAGDGPGGRADRGAQALWRAPVSVPRGFTAARLFVGRWLRRAAPSTRRRCCAPLDAYERVMRWHERGRRDGVDVPGACCPCCYCLAGCGADCLPSIQLRLADLKGVQRRDGDAAALLTAHMPRFLLHRRTLLVPHARGAPVPARLMFAPRSARRPMRALGRHDRGPAGSSTSAAGRARRRRGGRRGRGRAPRPARRRAGLTRPARPGSWTRL